ncbi:MAG: hypothetical protein RLZZ127_2555 [Planctomycetota bacterium]|jgi:hypothetical protein
METQETIYGTTLPHPRLDSGESLSHIIPMRPIALLALAATLAAADPRIIEGHRYPLSASSAAGAMTLVGAGEADWGWFDVHTAALYLPPGADPAAPLRSGPVRLILTYQRDFTAADFTKVTLKTFGAGLPPAEVAAFRPRLDRWNALYGPRKNGEAWQLTWLPGTGIELSDGTTVRGVVEGDDFARAMLGIWLGDPPVDADLRKALTGR